MLSVTRLPLGVTGTQLPRGFNMCDEQRPSFEQPITGPTDIVQLPQAVAIQHVHRAAQRDVLLTEWQRIEENSFTLHARWPADHPLYVAVRGKWHDPLLIAETVRQAGLVIAHAAYGVPSDHHFLMLELDSAVVEPSVQVAGETVELVLSLSAHDVRRRGDRLASMRYEVVISRDGRRMATGGARFSCATPQAYRRLRGAQLGATPAALVPARVTPSSVGRDGPENVVLADGTGTNRWQLLIDPGHPVFFDHPVDHVPGMLLVEAARQASESVTTPGKILPVALSAVFSRYVDFGTPCWIEARRGPTDGDGITLVRIAGRQDDQVMFEATISVQELR